MKNKNSALESELNKFKKLYRTAIHINLQKDLKVKHNENQLKNSGIAFDSEFVAGDFDRFRDFFCAKELASLRSLDLDWKTDSTFLKCAMQFLYKDNLSSLANKTVTGIKKMVVDGGIPRLITIKDSISPQKIEILKELFTERICSLPEDKCPDQRKKRFRTVLAKVVDRIRVDKLKSPRAKKKLLFIENC